MKRSLLCTVALSALFCSPVFAQQASITLKNSDVSYCYKQDVPWTLTKSNDRNTATSGDTVNWTITATKGDPGPKTLCAIGVVSITNTGSAPATIGNIVVDLQRNQGKPAKWAAISADVSNSTGGNGATSAKIVAAALQNQTVYTGVALVSGNTATFTENTYSGDLTFTDADSDEIWAITPEKTIGVGDTVTLFFNAVFNVDSLNFNTAEQLRTEVFVTFGNSGARGGSGASAENIDIDGSATLDADEAHVRTVPTRITKALPAVEVCNETVTITDTFSTTDTASYILTTDPIGLGVSTSASIIYTVIGTVSGEGTVSNTASLDGVGSTVTLTTGPTDPITGIAPTTTRPCCEATHMTANSSVAVSVPTPLAFCTYTQGKWNDRANNPKVNELQSNFSTYFPSGLVIGTIPISANGSTLPNYAKWTDVTKLRTWIGGGGPSTPLTNDTLNATSTSGGTLASQAGALTLNLNTSLVPTGIGNLILTGTGTSLDNKTVSQILSIANDVLGNNSCTGGFNNGGQCKGWSTLYMPDGYDYGTLNTLLDNLNKSWDDCEAGAFASKLRAPN